MPQRRAALECDSAQQAHVVGAGRAKAELVVAERQKARQEVERAQQPPVPLGSDDSILALADTFSAKRTAAAGAGATPTRSSAAARPKLLSGSKAELNKRWSCSAVLLINGEWLVTGKNAVTVNRARRR